MCVLVSGVKKVALLGPQETVHHEIEHPRRQGPEEDGHDDDARNEGLVIVDLRVKVDVPQQGFPRALPDRNIPGTYRKERGVQKVPDRFGRDVVRVVEEEADLRPCLERHLPAEIRRDDESRLVRSLLDSADGFPLVVQEREQNRFGARLDGAQILQNALRGGARILVHHRDREVRQLSLEGVSQDHEVDERHQDAHRDHDRVALELQQVPFDDRQQPSHLPNFCGTPAPTRKLTFFASSSRIDLPV